MKNNSVPGGCFSTSCLQVTEGTDLTGCPSAMCSCTIVSRRQKKPMKIALFVDESGNALSLNSSGRMEVYAYSGNNWRCIKKTAVSGVEEMSLPAIRNRVLFFVSELEDCKVLIAKNTGGILVSFLEGFGVDIRTTDGSPFEFFERITEHEQVEVADQLSSDIQPIVIIEGQDGSYTIDLVKLLKNNRSLTSRQALLPFLKETVFNRLEVICDHIPKWFDRELASMKLSFQVKDSDDAFCHAVIYPVR